MLTPGFLTDIVALLLLFPPTRVVARGWLMKRKGFATVGKARVIRAEYGRRPGHGPSSSKVTDTSATEVRGQLDQNDQ